MVTFPENAKTVGELYDPIFKIDNIEDAQYYLEKLIERHMKEWGGTVEEARKAQLNNIGYYAGYGSAADFAKVTTLFKAAHPFFGTTYPTAQQAMDAGYEAADTRAPGAGATEGGE